MQPRAERQTKDCKAERRSLEQGDKCKDKCKGLQGRGRRIQQSRAERQMQRTGRQMNRNAGYLVACAKPTRRLSTFGAGGLTTRTISAEGCPRQNQIALSTLACISRTRHARSPQRVVPDRDKSHSRLHFVHSTRTIPAEGCPPISAEGCDGQRQIALSPAFRALDTHDLTSAL